MERGFVSLQDPGEVLGVFVTHGERFSRQGERSSGPPGPKVGTRVTGCLDCYDVCSSCFGYWVLPCLLLWLLLLLVMAFWVGHSCHVFFHTPYWGNL